MTKTVFLHPDLGIGGAERAVIDAALALKSRNHDVEFLTAHHDPSHCFQETKDGTLKVTVVGDWLPRSIFGKCYALCAYIRMIYAAVYLVFFSNITHNIIFCDQISACIPVLRFSKSKVLFYCHFPDMLLTQRKSFLKKIYRAPLDWFEEWTTGMADCILVNSKFTASIFKATFKSLSAKDPAVLYPIPDFKAFEKEIEDPADDLLPANKKIYFLSINRYERKKNLALAIQAFGQLKDKLSKSDGDKIHLVMAGGYDDRVTENGQLKDKLSKSDGDKIHLVMAGGYDDRVTENVEHYSELKQLSDKLGINEDVTFLRSFSDAQKRTLLHHSHCLLYTPDNEHFGIVPIEAMYMKCPVIACKSGGPLETVVDGKTGFLREGRPDQFAEAMQRIVDDLVQAKKFGDNGRKHVLEKFSFDTFTDQLDKIIKELMN